MVNKQAPEPRDLQPDTLVVHSIFQTIQGEGPFSGRPCVFIRLAGCNITCPGCDTEYTGIRRVMGLDEIMTEVAVMDVESQYGLVVITGGEPLRQNVLPLIKLLQNEQIHVQIETNGTLPPPEGFDSLDTPVTVVCSPKAPRVNPKLAPFVDAYKYVLDSDDIDPQDGLPMTVLGGPVRPARPHEGFAGRIYLSPMDVQDPAKNHTNTRAAVNVCMEFGYILNLQIHKLVGLP
jgi:7-carboxy-7-deazaguanine synthase